jgi:hypothetical protein
MMRGTVYVLEADRLERHVITVDVDTAEQFKAWAQQSRVGEADGDSIRLEFGPIGVPWSYGQRPPRIHG